ncbi:MAG: DNA primase [Bacteroidaceae bacterium]|nr:DNA primase [Bacteroidaceae bacterium]
MIDRATVDRILDAANIVDVVSDFVTLKRAGANLKGLCPFHDDRTPSFMVSPSKNICKCFACGEGGTPVHFIMKHEQLSYPDALRYLAKKYHIEIKERELSDEERAEAGERESLFVVNEWANTWFQQQMFDTPDGRAVGLAYFRQRGFRDDIIRKFQLGYCPDRYDAQWQAGRAAGYKEDYLLQTGLCIRNEAGKTYDRFRARVIFPIHTVSGKVVGFGGRVLAAATKGVSIKYQNSPESSIYSKKRELYGLFFAKKAIVKADLCYLVEGYTDVMAMHQMGVENVVASSGTALTHEQIRAIHRFTENITVIYDGDAAGIKASQRGIDMILAEGMNVKLLLLPDDDDPDSFARKHTSEEYQAYLREHQVDFIRFKTDLVLSEAKGDPIQLSRLTNNIVVSLAQIPDDITRTLYIKETAQTMGMREELITSAVARVRKQQREERQREREREQRQAAAGSTDGQANPGSSTGPAGVSNSDSSSGISNSSSSSSSPSPSSSSNPADSGLTPEEEAMLAAGLDPSAAAPPQPSAPATVLSTANKAAEQLFTKKEELLIQMLVRHGEKVMCDVEGDDGETQPLTVIDYIRYSLEQDGLQLRNPLFARMLGEAIAHAGDEGFRASRYFENHPDETISQLSTRLAHDDETLSKIHSRTKAIAPDEDRLVEIMPHLMTDYKLAIIDDLIANLMAELRNPAITSDKSRFLELMTKLQESKLAQKELAKQCGDRVLL